MDEEISPVSLPTDIAALVDAINKLPEDVRVEAGIDEVLPRAVEYVRRRKRSIQGRLRLI